ncbi:MAG: Lrp/AsnC family transcriptional regulator [Nitrososphaerales archaeon]
MPIAFVLINVDAGSEREVVQELKATDNVKDVYSVYGPYDIVVKIEAETQQKLKDTITWNVRRIEKIRSTQTLMVS